MRSASLLVAFALLTACGDDAVKPGNLNVKWSHLATVTCGSAGLTTIRARALKGTVEAASVTENCADSDKSGEILLSDLDPTTYKIEVEGIQGDGKGTYLGVIPKQGVTEGKTRDTEVVQLSPKPVFLHVDWTLPGGGRCATAGISEVEVIVITGAGGSPKEAGKQKVDCDNSLPDPRDETKTLTGVVFDAIEPDDSVAIILYGYDANDDAIARGETAAFPIVAGDELEEVVELETCPGTPPVCE